VSRLRLHSYWRSSAACRVRLALQYKGLAQMLVADIQPLQNTAVMRLLREQHGRPDEQAKGWVRERVGRGMRALEQRQPDADT